VVPGAGGTQGSDLAILANVGISTVALLGGGYDGVAMANFLKVLSALKLLDQAHQLLQPERDPEMVRFALRAQRR